MIMFRLIVRNQTIVSVTETFSKMASTICQKWLTSFCQKDQNFVYFGSYTFVQISPACGPNTYQIMYVSNSNGNIKYPIGKSIFAVNLPLKLFPATIAYAEIESLKSLHKFLKKCLYHMLVKFEQNRMDQTTRNFDFFYKKPGFLKPFLTKR